MPQYTATIKVNVSGKISLEKLKQTLSEGVYLDIDTDDMPNGMAIEIDWDTLKKDEGIPT